MRFSDAFIGMSRHVFVGMIVMVPQPYGRYSAVDVLRPVEGQTIAGAAAWSSGEPIAVVAICAFALR
ncbi:hypothetical protein [Tsukamurella sp. PLM1]|uniref:hypothetical protein n=1 Tax=Tsukamurella sp. PLM1 TaxID=2929795 RepID=UPI00206F5A74|nr:hypothetical protein [Tsukamurella sp. PLM1]BDH59730.1 hypothetical protein MTP03_46690 [Tsukamurella sp. PLM1]